MRNDQAVKKGAFKSKLKTDSPAAFKTNLELSLKTTPIELSQSW